MASDCKHEAFDAAVDVTFLADVGQWRAEVRIRCRSCELPFSFVGPAVGFLTDQAAVNPNRTELRVRIEPGPTPFSFDGGSVRFEIPTKPRAN